LLMLCSLCILDSKFDETKNSLWNKESPVLKTSPITLQG
jgi:hypothetical protein